MRLWTVALGVERVEPHALQPPGHGDRSACLASWPARSALVAGLRGRTQSAGGRGWHGATWAWRSRPAGSTKPGGWAAGLVSGRDENPAQREGCKTVGRHSAALPPPEGKRPAGPARFPLRACLSAHPHTKGLAGPRSCWSDAALPPPLRSRVQVLPLCVALVHEVADWLETGVQWCCSLASGHSRTGTRAMGAVLGLASLDLGIWPRSGVQDRQSELAERFQSCRGTLPRKHPQAKRLDRGLGGGRVGLG